MLILVLYATTEGQTRKIARYAADYLVQNGTSVELAAAADAPGLAMGRFDGVVLMGSIHAGRYQAELVDFIADQRNALAAMPHAFVSVSLGAASDKPEDRDGIEACVARLSADTGWSPGQVAHVAGAFRFTQYDFFKSWAMRWIASRNDPGVRTDEDTEYTDWDALAAFLDRWTLNVASASGSNSDPVVGQTTGEND